MDDNKLLIKDSLNKLETDFKAEVILAGLIDTNQEIDKNVIIRQRGNRRNVSKDIHKIGNIYSDYDLLEYLAVYTNRTSIYDSLPEGLFHQGEGSKRSRSTEGIVEEIRNQRNEEKLARRFFQPFEMILDQMLVDVQLYEQKFDKAYIHDNLRRIFDDQWDILQHMSLKQSLLFLRVVPYIHQVLTDYDQISIIISAILECPIKIKENRKSRISLCDGDKKGLGKAKLNVNFVLGKSIEYDNPDLTITVGPIDPDIMKLYESNAPNKQILTKLIDMVVPFDRNKNIQYKISQKNTKFKLSDTTHKAYLGINTRI